MLSVIRRQDGEIFFVKISEAVRADYLADLVHRVLVGDEIFLRVDVSTVPTGVFERRCGDSDVNLACSGNSLHSALPCAQPDGKNGEDGKLQAPAKRESQIRNAHLAPSPWLYRRGVQDRKRTPNEAP